MTSRSLSFYFKSITSLLIFGTASAFQFDSHKHLASLEKYSLPGRNIFQWLLCPHYFAECIIYFALAMVSARPGQFLNGTVTAALVFTTVNLGITSQTSKEWYEERFGKENVESRYRMIPYIF